MLPNSIMVLTNSIVVLTHSIIVLTNYIIVLTNCTLRQYQVVVGRDPLRDLRPQLLLCLA